MTSKKFVLELDEDKAEWIRIGLQCYRDTCQVPASFGSTEFMEKVHQVSSAIDWFDEELVDARFWERSKDVPGKVTATTARKKPSKPKKRNRIVTADEVVGNLDKSRQRLDLPKYDEVNIVHEQSPDKKVGFTVTKNTEAAEHDDSARTAIQYRNDHNAMIADLGQICALVEEWREGHWPASRFAEHVEELMKSKGYLK